MPKIAKILQKLPKRNQGLGDQTPQNFRHELSVCPDTMNVILVSCICTMQFYDIRGAKLYFVLWMNFNKKKSAELL